MVYIVYNGKLWFFSTMWILTPIGCVILYKLIQRTEQKRKRVQEEWAEYYKAHGITPPNDIRGGQQDPFESEFVPELVNVTNPGFICLVQDGVSYVKNNGYKQLAIRHFNDKAKDGVIFFTKSAFCQLIVLQGLEIGPGFMNTFGISSWVNPVRNSIGIGTAVYGLHLIWCSIRDQIPVGLDAGLFSKNRRISLIGGIVSLLVSLLSMFWNRNPGFVFISSTVIAIDGKVVSRVTSRIPELIDVVIVNSKNANKALTIKKEDPSGICKIPGVAKFWKKCPPKVTFTDPELGVEYHDMVNMNDVIKLSLDDNQKFNDLLDVGNPNLAETVPEPPRIKGTMSKTARIKAKVVHFLDKFKDPEVIPDESRWETKDELNPVVKDRIRNKK